MRTQLTAVVAMTELPAVQSVSGTGQDTTAAVATASGGAYIDRPPVRAFLWLGIAGVSHARHVELRGRHVQSRRWSVFLATVGGCWLRTFPGLAANIPSAGTASSWYAQAGTEQRSTVARTWAPDWLPTRVTSSLLVMGPGLGACLPRRWWGGPVEHEPSLQWVGRCLG